VEVDEDDFVALAGDPVAVFFDGVVDRWHPAPNPSPDLVAEITTS